MLNIRLAQSKMRLSNLSNLIDLDVELHMHLIHKLNSGHVKCDV